MLLHLARRSCAAATSRTCSVAHIRSIIRLQPVTLFHSKAFALAEPVATPSSTTVAAPSAEVDPPPPKPQRPRPTSRYTTRRTTPSSFFETPKPPTVETKEQMQALERKGHDGETYDMLTCYQLGCLFFDGIPARTGAASSSSFSTPPAAVSTVPSTPASAPAASEKSHDGGAPLEIAPEQPWSLPKNYTQSLLWYTNAAFEGHVPSRTKLGVMYLAGYGIKRNIPVAFQLFTEASESGDREAMSHLAAMWLQGVGAPKKDISKAIEWYSNAADRGHVRAQAVLAKLLDTPEAGAARSASKAAHWLHESARLGHVESQFLLAQRYEAAAASFAPSTTPPSSSSSPATSTSSRSNTSDPASAASRDSFSWLLRAADNGHAQAQYLVGLSFAENRPVVRSHAAAASEQTRQTEAAKWYKRASDQGNVHAQARLGFALYRGAGIDQDKGNGVMWLNNAAEANHVDAQLMLGSIAYEEHVAFAASAASAAASTSTSIASLGSTEDDKKLQTAKHYFGKVLENANKNCTSLPSGSLPLLVRMSQEPALPSQLIRMFQENTGQPWLGDINRFLATVIPLSKSVPTTASK